MIRLNQQNINTPEYWDNVYAEEIKAGRLRVEKERFQRTANIITDGADVIDIGCGKGEFLQYLHDRKPACRIMGIDFSTESINFAKKYVPCGNFYVVDALNVSYYVSFMKKFDFAVSFETIEHIENPKMFVDEASFTLKKGGWFILSTPFENRVDGGAEHVYSFNYQDIVSFFSRDKWELVTLTRYGRDYSNMYILAQTIQ